MIKILSVNGLDKIPEYIKKTWRGIMHGETSTIRVDSTIQHNYYDMTRRDDMLINDKETESLTRVRIWHSFINKMNWAKFKTLTSRSEGYHQVKNKKPPAVFWRIILISPDTGSYKRWFIM